MSGTSVSVSQLRIGALLARRDVSAKFADIWIYLLTSLLLAAVAIYGSGFQRAFESETVAVAADPLLPAHAIALVLLGLAVGLRCATSISWEREHRTMEVRLSAQKPDDLSLPLLLLRRGLEPVTLALSWVSPVSYLTAILKVPL